MNKFSSHKFSSFILQCFSLNDRVKQSCDLSRPRDFKQANSHRVIPSYYSKKLRL